MSMSYSILVTISQLSDHTILLFRDIVIPRENRLVGTNAKMMYGTFYCGPKRTSANMVN